MAALCPVLLNGNFSVKSSMANVSSAKISACPVPLVVEATSYVAGLMYSGASHLEPDAHNPRCGCGHMIMARLYWHVIVRREVRGTTCGHLLTARTPRSALYQDFRTPRVPAMFNVLTSGHSYTSGVHLLMLRAGKGERSRGYREVSHPDGCKNLSSS